MQTKTFDSALVAGWFHALSDETRLAIVRNLASGECCVCELQGTLEAAQSRLSFHLKVLKDAGVVSDRKQGRWMYYSLNPDLLESMEVFIADLRSEAEKWQGENRCCT